MIGGLFNVGDSAYSTPRYAADICRLCLEAAVFPSMSPSNMGRYSSSESELVPGDG